MKLSRGLASCSVFAVWAACGSEPPPPEPSVRPVKMMTVGILKNLPALEFPGRITAATTADLSFEVPGEVVSLTVDDGESVNKGQVLTKIRSTDFVADHNEARAVEREARTKYERAKKLYASGSMARQELDIARREFDVARARTSKTNKALGDTQLRAPFTGVVAIVHIDNHESVLAKQSVMVLQGKSKLKLEVDLPERVLTKYGGKVERPKQATKRFHPMVEISVLPGKRFPARFSSVAAKADPATRTFKAELSFDVPEEKILWPGMTARLRLTPGAGPGAIAIPGNAVAGAVDGEAVVFVVDTKTMTVKRSPVEVGKMFGDQVRIDKGLKEGQTIAISGISLLDDGMKVSRYQRLDEDNKRK